MKTFAITLGLVISLCGCSQTRPVETEPVEVVELYAMGEGYTDPPAGYLYVGDVNSFIVYYPDCPLVTSIPPENFRYYTEIPRWHRLDEDCRGTTDPCEGVVCTNGQVCIEGVCVDPDPCEGVTCTNGLVCYEGECVDPCSLVVCSNGFICINGVCVNLCEGVDCGDGFICIDGGCYPDELAAQSYMTGPVGWNDNITVQPSITIHPKDLDSDHDIDMKDFAIACAIGTWDIPVLDWESWPPITLYIKSNFRYNIDNWERIDDVVISPDTVVVRAHSLEVPFGWIWNGRTLCDSGYVHRNSLLYGKTFEDKISATRHYYGTKAENWSDAGDLSILPRPDIDSNGLTTTVKTLFRHTFYPEWEVTFTGDDLNGATHTDACVLGVSLSKDGWELIIDDMSTNGTLYIPVVHYDMVQILDTSTVMREIDMGYIVGSGSGSGWGIDYQGNKDYWLDIGGRMWYTVVERYDF